MVFYYTSNKASDFLVYVSKMEVKKDGKLKLVGCYRYDNRGQFETEENDENGNLFND